MPDRSAAEAARGYWKATSRLTLGLLVIWFVRNHVAKGFALGRV